MLIQTQSPTLPHLPYIPPSSHISNPISFSPHSFSTKSFKIRSFNLSRKSPFLKTSFQAVKCLVSSSLSELTHTDSALTKPSPAEICRTIMELSCSGTLSTVTQEGWPIGTGVQFAVDPQGTPILCLSPSNTRFLNQDSSSLHVQLEQRGSRITQCMLQGRLNKPEDKNVLQELGLLWVKKFGEEVEEDLLHILSVDRILQIADLKEDGTWVTSSEYRCACPDPLRDSAENIVNEINMDHMEDFERICNIYLSIDFQVTDASLIWVDRLGFDVHIRSPQNEMFEARIPFPREVSDEKGVKSTFNCMSQHAWEVDRGYTQPDFEKSTHLKQISWYI